MWQRCQDARLFRQRVDIEISVYKECLTIIKATCHLELRSARPRIERTKRNCTFRGPKSQPYGELGATCPGSSDFKCSTTFGRRPSVRQRILYFCSAPNKLPCLVLTKLCFFFLGRARAAIEVSTRTRVRPGKQEEGQVSERPGRPVPPLGAAELAARRRLLGVKEANERRRVCVVLAFCVGRHAADEPQQHCALSVGQAVPRSADKRPTSLLGRKTDSFALGAPYGGKFQAKVKIFFLFLCVHFFFFKLDFVFGAAGRKRVVWCVCARGCGTGPRRRKRRSASGLSRGEVPLPEVSTNSSASCHLSLFLGWNSGSVAEG
ncbi:unnamed protein product [Ixodes pacificus]